jgi:serpin B
MVVLLPRKPDGLAAVEKALDAKKLADWLGRLEKQEVTVGLPRFKITSAFRLDETLKALGMKDAFAAKADFSGMTGTKDLYIGAALHKAFVDVNEEGTEAAAATAVMMTPNGGGHPVFKADRPFVFLIRDRSTGSVLFFGRVADPTKAD